MNEKVVFSQGRDALVAHIKCEIDHHTAKKIREEIDVRLLGELPAVLVLDFSEVSFMDSSGLGLILGRCERADSFGGRVRIVGLSASLYKLVRICGIERIRNLSVRC